MSDDAQQQPSEQRLSESASTEAAAAGRRPQPRPAAGRVLTNLLVIVLLLSVGANLVLGLMFLLTADALFAGESRQLRELHHSRDRDAADKIAILSLEGVILEGDYFKQQLDEIRKDKNVKAVVLRINSPGGTISGSDYMHHHLQELMQDRPDLPVVVSMGTICASGGYYVAMGTAGQDHDKVIFAEPTSWTGSIGVIIPHYDASVLAEKIGIQEDSVKSHPRKGMGSMLREMKPEEEAIFKALVDEAFDRFKTIVKQGRPGMSDETLETVATGQVFTAQQALDFGLVDATGFLEDAIDHAAKLADLDKEKVRVIRYQRQLDLIDRMILGHAKAQSPGLDLRALIELSTPKAYYLCSWMPGLHSRSEFELN